MFTQLSTWLKLELVVPVQIHMTVILYVYKIWRLLFMSYELMWERDGRIATITAYEGQHSIGSWWTNLVKVTPHLHSQLHCPCLYLVLLASLQLTIFERFFYYCIVCVHTIHTYRVYWLDSSIPAQMLWSKIKENRSGSSGGTTIFAG